jgi:hypothetical protein
MQGIRMIFLKLW